ncbi:MAG: DUF3592 domain-containing protein [Anaerolineales bacterium]|nr:DUF3592 domain-containing protein [Anaerolineales bacterium]
MTNFGPLAFAVLCGGIFILASWGIGIFLIFSSLRSRQKAQDSLSWSSTAGQITNAEVKESVSVDDDDRRRYAYYPSVHYAYQVNGQAYTSKRISFGGVIGYNSPQKAEAYLAHFPVGSQASVYYNPQNPSEAVLERTAGGSRWGMIVGLVCLAIGACITCGLAVGIINNLK